MTTLRCCTGLLAAFLAVGINPSHGMFAEDFSSGLINWESDGDVSAPAGEALLRDALAPYSLLYQLLPLPPGTYILDVDVSHALSSAVPAGRLPDVFFASMYFIDDPGTFDLAGRNFDGAVPLFDISAAGFANVQGQVGSSTKGAGWSHYTGTFELTHNHAIPVFELNDDNAIASDSRVTLDNLRISLIPEPQVIALLLVGLSTLAAIRHRTRR